jgi:transaldolase
VEEDFVTFLSDNAVERIRDFVLEGIDTARHEFPGAADPFWQQLRDAGTEIWLDTGDIDAAKENWTAEMSALTTNNTLLNKEIQKGIYDDFIPKADRLLEGVEREQRIQEIAFILNARHGLRLVQTFGGKVSVELHTALADDLDGIVHYGRRFHEIEPEHFIVKVPLTATGLLGARKLRELGIPVNFTLEFSARQNAIVSVVAQPNYCNVFLGRLNSYVKDHGLGDGVNVGEKATISSQRIIRELTAHRDVPTRQIAASMRDASQAVKLAGMDVFTMPTKVAAEAHGTGSISFENQVDTDYPVSLNPGVEPVEVQVEKLWEVPDAVRDFAGSCDSDTPRTGDELAERARKMGLADMFPPLSTADHQRIADDGKIPDHSFWKDRIRTGEVAVDTLLNLAGLASFTQDQKQLDDRIAGLIG